MMRKICQNSHLMYDNDASSHRYYPHHTSQSTPQSVRSPSSPHRPRQQRALHKHRSHWLKRPRPIGTSKATTSNTPPQVSPLCFASKIRAIIFSVSVASAQRIGELSTASHISSEYAPLVIERGVS